MSECIVNTGLFRFLFGSKHQFKDVYDIEESIPEKIIQSASRYSDCAAEGYVLEQGKLTKRTYVKSYCTRCGLEILKNDQNPTTSTCSQNTITTYSQKEQQ